MRRDIESEKVCVNVWQDSISIGIQISNNERLELAIAKTNSKFDLLTCSDKSLVSA